MSSQFVTKTPVHFSIRALARAATQRRTVGELILSNVYRSLATTSEVRWLHCEKHCCSETKKCLFSPTHISYTVICKEIAISFSLCATIRQPFGQCSQLLLCCTFAPHPNDSLMILLKLRQFDIWWRDTLHSSKHPNFIPLIHLRTHFLHLLSHLQSECTTTNRTTISQATLPLPSCVNTPNADVIHHHTVIIWSYVDFLLSFTHTCTRCLEMRQAHRQTGWGMGCLLHVRLQMRTPVLLSVLSAMTESSSWVISERKPCPFPTFHCLLCDDYHLMSQILSSTIWRVKQDVKLRPSYLNVI